jgi:mono/diheme cytochrome c family protein
MRVGYGMWWMVAVSGLLVFALPAPLTATERDPLQPRVPKQELEAAKAMTNPFPATPENIAKGDGLYHGKGTCFVCHGQTGVGDGSAAVGLDPSPRNFTNAAFHRARTDGELMWVLKHGSAGTAMVPLVGSVIDEDEAWLILLYERSFAKAGS